MWVIGITQEDVGGPEVSASLSYKHCQFRNPHHGVMNKFRTIITALPIRRLAQPGHFGVYVIIIVNLRSGFHIEFLTEQGVRYQERGSKTDESHGRAQDLDWTFPINTGFACRPGFPAVPLRLSLICRVLEAPFGFVRDGESLS